LLQAELPKDVIKMLSGCIPTSLAEPFEDRHAWQAETVQWIGTALAGVESSLAQRVSDARVCLDKINTEQAAREAVVGASAESLLSLQEAAAVAEAKRAEVVAAHRAAEAALKAASVALAAGDTELVRVAGFTSELQAMMADGGSYVSWKTAEASSESADDFATLMKRHGFEAGLIDSLPLVLVKSPSARTDFTLMVMRQFEAAVDKRLAELAEKQSSGEAVQVERQQAVNAAAECAKSAAAEVDTAMAVAQEAQASSKSGEVALKDAKKAVKELASATREAQVAEKAAAAASTAFEQGPLTAFRQLQAPRAAPETEDQRVPQADECQAAEPPQEPKFEAQELQAGDALKQVSLESSVAAMLAPGLAGA